MIKSHLAIRIAEKKIKIIDVVRATGIDRSTVTKLYHDRLQRLELEVLDKLCDFFDCEVEDILYREASATSDQIESTLTQGRS